MVGYGRVRKEKSIHRDGWTHSYGNEAILGGGGGNGIYFRRSSKNEGNRKSKAMFGTGNTENQYINYGEQGIKRFIHREQGRR